MTKIDDFRGVALVQRGAEDLVAVAGGTTGGEPDTPCGPGTRFQVASVSKSFTAAAVLLLAERGALSLTDPVGRWLPGGPPAWDAITLHHLLSNSSGLVHWEGLPGLDLTARMPPAQKLQTFGTADLLSPPGTRFSYSSPGFSVLGHVVEQASGLPYASFLARELFAPAGMGATFAGSGAGLPGLATGHVDGKPVTAPFELDTTGLGAGDIWSTPADLARWDRALAAGEVLGPATLAPMITVQAPVEDDDGVVRTEGYGYGWFIGTTRGRRIVYHPGNNIGFRSINAWFPDDDVRVIMLSNEQSITIDPVVHQLLDAAFPAAG